MDPMANQGMFGGYGMNMTGMGMNSGMNYNGGMYGSLGWDTSQNNTMWQGGQDKFNPNAFANGTGPPYGGAFGGSNMSAYPSDYQSGYYGQGYGRGGFRGRGRGQYHGSGRGGYGPHGHYHANSGYSNQNTSVEGSNPVNGGNPNVPESSEKGVPGDNPNPLQGIPTIDSLDQSVSMSNGSHPYYAHPGVEGAPAAPRAMRQGLPNTSVFRQRGFQIQGRASNSGYDLPFLCFVFFVLSWHQSINSDFHQVNTILNNLTPQLSKDVSNLDLHLDHRHILLLVPVHLLFTVLKTAETVAVGQKPNAWIESTNYNPMPVAPALHLEHPLVGLRDAGITIMIGRETEKTVTVHNAPVVIAAAAAAQVEMEILVLLLI